MSPDEGGIKRVALLLSASLFLHLALFVAAIGLSRREPARPPPGPPLSVDYLGPREPEESRPTTSQPRPIRPSAARQAAPHAPATASGRRHPPPPGTVVARRETEPPASSSGQTSPGAPRQRDGGGSPRARSSLPAERGGLELTVGAAGVNGKGAGTGGGQGTGGGARGRSVGAGGPGSAGHGIGSPGHGAYKAELLRLIEAHKAYPLAARKYGAEGSCLRRFVITRGGALKQVETLSSCGHLFLDEAATRAITTVGTFPPLPDEIPGREANFTVTITFTLPGK